MKTWFFVDAVFSTKHTKHPAPLWRFGNFFPSRGRGVWCRVIPQWTKHASGNTRQVMFQDVLRVSIKNSGFAYCEKMGYI